MDAFSEVLSSVRLKGAMFFNAEFSAPWCISSPPSDGLAPYLVPGAEHVVIYHLLTEGTASARLENGESVSLNPGDIVVFPHGDAHRLESGAPSEAMSPEKILNLVRTQGLVSISTGGGGLVTRFICGYMACDRKLCGPILDGLPRIFKVNVCEDSAGEWLENSIRHMVSEVDRNRPGSIAMLSKLSEALFVETLRRYIATIPAESTGWLAGSRDPVVGKSLAILHNRVEYPWTIAELAKEVGLSRSALVERFTCYLAEPPMAYLAKWRMRLAARALTATSHSVAQIASEVGYESEAAFNRAFKREFGTPPARYRREQKQGTPVPTLAAAGR